jgi:hypothetical protein
MISPLEVSCSDASRGTGVSVFRNFWTGNVPREITEQRSSCSVEKTRSQHLPQQFLAGCGKRDQQTWNLKSCWQESGCTRCPFTHNRRRPSHSVQKGTSASFKRDLLRAAASGFGAELPRSNQRKHGVFPHTKVINQHPSEVLFQHSRTTLSGVRRLGQLFISTRVEWEWSVFSDKQLSSA